MNSRINKTDLQALIDEIKAEELNEDNLSETVDGSNHYVYWARRTSPGNGPTDYIGVRSCDGPAADDIGVRYKSSSALLRDAIRAGAEFDWTVIAEFGTRKQASLMEVVLHSKLAVQSDPAFYNKKNATLVGPFVGMWHDEEYRAMQSETTSDQVSRQWAEDPAYRAAVVEASSKTMKSLWSDPEFAEARSLEAKERWDDPAYRSKMIALRKRQWAEDSEYRKKMSESSVETATRMWQRPEIRQRISEAASKQVSRQWAEDPAYRAAVVEASSKTMKSLWSDPEFAEARSLETKERWDDPAYQAKMSTTKKRQWEEDPEYQATMSASVKLLNARGNETADFCKALKTQHPEGFPSGVGWVRSGKKMLTYIRAAGEALGFDAEAKIKELGW